MKKKEKSEKVTFEKTVAPSHVDVKPAPKYQKKSENEKENDDDEEWHTANRGPRQFGENTQERGRGGNRGRGGRGGRGWRGKNDGERRGGERGGERGGDRGGERGERRPYTQGGENGEVGEKKRYWNKDGDNKRGGKPWERRGGRGGDRGGDRGGKRWGGQKDGEKTGDNEKVPNSGADKHEGGLKEIGALPQKTAPVVVNKEETQN